MERSMDLIKEFSINGTLLSIYHTQDLVTVFVVNHGVMALPTFNR